jgi:hypothetical protein
MTKLQQYVREKKEAEVAAQKASKMAELKRIQKELGV